MKRAILAVVGVLTMAASLGVANAADIAHRRVMPVKAPYYAAYNWTGFYIGINGGGAWGNSNWAAIPTGNFNTSGGLVGGTVGYNLQMGQTVLGLESDIDWSNIKGSSAAAGCGTACETRNNWLGTTRGRLGYAFNRVLPYVTGGLAYGDIKSGVTGGGSDTNTKAGWTAGGGVEVALAGPWTVKAEYLYVDLGKGNCSAATCGAAASSVKFDANVARAGLNYHF